jgi:membrane-bound transcription factor site-1 protease
VLTLSRFFFVVDRYYTSMPIIVNVTILNGMGVSGKVIGDPKWIPVVENPHETLDLLEVSFRWSETLWPWYSLFPNN